MIVMNGDGSNIYVYVWDGEWFGLNGYLVYIVDI